MRYEIYNSSDTKEKRRELRKNQTETENRIWQIVRGKRLNGYKFFRQYGIDHYIADFYCPELKLVIEIDGSQHYTEEGTEYDKIREEFMASLGIKTVRFSNYEVMSNIEGVINILSNYIEKVLK